MPHRSSDNDVADKPHGDRLAFARHPARQIGEHALPGDSAGSDLEQQHGAGVADGDEGA